MLKNQVAKSAPGGPPSAELIARMLAGLESPRAGVKFGASKALRTLSAGFPELLYPRFDPIAGLLAHPNQILVWNATLTLANLAVVDDQGKIEAVLGTYLRLMRGPGLVTAANAIRAATIIGLARQIGRAHV